MLSRSVFSLAMVGLLVTPALAQDWGPLVQDRNTSTGEYCLPKPVPSEERDSSGYVAYRVTFTKKCSVTYRISAKKLPVNTSKTLPEQGLTLKPYSTDYLVCTSYTQNPDTSCRGYGELTVGSRDY